MYYKESRKTNNMKRKKNRIIKICTTVQYVYELYHTVSHLLFVHICTVIRGIFYIVHVIVPQSEADETGCKKLPIGESKEQRGCALAPQTGIASVGSRQLSLQLTPPYFSSSFKLRCTSCIIRGNMHVYSTYHLLYCSAVDQRSLHPPQFAFSCPAGVTYKVIKLRNFVFQAKFRPRN